MDGKQQKSILLLHFLRFVDEKPAISTAICGRKYDCNKTEYFLTFIIISSTINDNLHGTLCTDTSWAL
jgi:hypothetical protein